MKANQKEVFKGFQIAQEAGQFRAFVKFGYGGKYIRVYCIVRQYKSALCRRKYWKYTIKVFSKLLLIDDPVLLEYSGFKTALQVINSCNKFLRF